MWALYTALLLPTTVPSNVSDQKLKALDSQIRALSNGFQGRLGYCLTLLPSGKQISYRGSERFPSASTIKTGVMLAAMREVEAGRMKWTDKRVLPPKPNREASMWSYYLVDNIKLDLDGWVNLMITVSDNTATMVVRDWIGTMNVNRHLESLGLQETKILGNAPPSEERIQRLRGQFGMGMTTPIEMNRLVEMIYQRKAASPAACDKMLRILGKQYWDDWVGTTVPPEVRVFNKTGAINRSRSEVAIVLGPKQTYILTIYTDSQKDQRWTDDNEGETALKKICHWVWETTQGSPYYQPKGSEKFAPTGGGVEDS